MRVRAERAEGFFGTVARGREAVRAQADPGEEGDQRDVLARPGLSGSSGLPKSLRLSVASAISATFLQLLLDPAAEHRHFLRRLLVALALGDGDSLAVRGQRFFGTVGLGERASGSFHAAEYPGSRVTASRSCATAFCAVARLEIFVPERESQQRAVACRSDELV